MSDATPSGTIRFDEERHALVHRYLKQDQQRHLLDVLDRTDSLIDGFQSPIGIELLATIDWLIEREQYEPTVTGIRQGLARWPAGPAAAERKLRLFNDRLIGIALHLIAPDPGNRPVPGQ